QRAPVRARARAGGGGDDRRARPRHRDRPGGADALQGARRRRGHRARARGRPAARDRPERPVAPGPAAGRGDRPAPGAAERHARSERGPVGGARSLPAPPAGPGRPGGAPRADRSGRGRPPRGARHPGRAPGPPRRPAGGARPPARGRRRARPARALAGRGARVGRRRGRGGRHAPTTRTPARAPSRARHHPGDRPLRGRGGARRGGAPGRPSGRGAPAPHRRHRVIPELPESQDGGRAFMSEDPKLEELDKLISTGKQKGYVTYDELNDALPTDLVSPYQMDDIMLMFGAMDIDVVDAAKAPRLANEIEDSLDEREEAAPAEPGEAIDLSPGPIGRTEDPVRMYLREMGGVSLLTREGEIALAKRIEEGKEGVTRAVMSTNLAKREFQELRDGLRKARMSVRDIIDISDEEFTEEKEIELTRQVINAFA